MMPALSSLQPPASAIENREACASLLRKIRQHAADGLAAHAASDEPMAAIAARELQQAKPHLKSSAAKAMMLGTTAMLDVVETWGAELAERIATEASQREATLELLVHEHVDLTESEVASFVDARSAAAAAERQTSVRELTQVLTGHATKERETFSQALSAKLESAGHQLRVQQQQFLARTAELEARNTELEAQLAVSEENVIAAARREEAAKATCDEKLKAAQSGEKMGRNALKLRIRRLERELHGEKDTRLRMQSKSAAAKALWGKASDGVSSGLFARLASAAAEQEKPWLVSPLDHDEGAEQPDDNDLDASSPVPSPQPKENMMVQQLEQERSFMEERLASTPNKVSTTVEVTSTVATLPSLKTPEPSAASSKTGGGGIVVSPLFESPGAPQQTPAKKDRSPTSERPPSAGGPFRPNRRDSPGLQRLTASRPQSALSLRRQKAVADAEEAKSLAAAADAEKASPTSRMLQRRASAPSMRENSFMTPTAASMERTVEKKPAAQVQRVPLGVRLQGLDEVGVVSTRLSLYT